MTGIAIGIFSALILWFSTRCFRTSQFIAHLHRPLQLPSSEQSFSPNATIVLCLRGADPFLTNCLQGLLTQNYSRYQVQIVVDSEDDPAWSVVTQFLAQYPSTVPVHLDTLKHPKLTCSLKCSSLLQAIANLDPTCEVVAFLDADTIAHPTWLTDLIMPLHDPHIGATSGYRWYLPHDSQWGSVVRHLWNLSAVVLMQTFKIPWGGSLATRTQVLHESGLLQIWARSLTEDAPFYQALKAKGLGITFVPSLISANRERCDLPSFLRWSQRQSLLVRLYHPAWVLVCADAVINIVLFSSSLIALLTALSVQQFAAAQWLAIGLGIYLTGIVALAQLIDQNIRQILAKREKLPPISIAHRIKQILAVPFSILVCGTATLLAQRLYKVQWRGINYQVTEPRTIRLMEYRPYRKVERPADPMASL